MAVDAVAAKRDAQLLRPASIRRRAYVGPFYRCRAFGGVRWFRVQPGQLPGRSPAHRRDLLGKPSRPVAAAREVWQDEWDGDARAHGRKGLDRWDDRRGLGALGDSLARDEAPRRGAVQRRPV